MTLHKTLALLLLAGLPFLLVSAQEKDDTTPKQEAEPAKGDAAGQLAVEAGPVTLKKRSAGKSAAVEKKIVKGLTADLETEETAVVGEEAKAVAEFGGCKITLMENTTFEVLEVGEDVSVVEILGVEMELETGTEMECEFGSLKVNLAKGSFKANPKPGVVTTLRIVTASGQTLNFTLQPGAQVNLARGANGQLVVSVPPGAPDVQMTVTSRDASGNEVTSAPKQFKSGSTQKTDTIVQGQTEFLASESNPQTGRSSPAEILQEQTESSNQDQPPSGTVVGSLPISTGLGN